MVISTKNERWIQNCRKTALMFVGGHDKITPRRKHVAGDLLVEFFKHIDD
jgi:hypothetical protein